MTPRAIATLVVLSAFAAACGSNSTSATSPSTVTSPTTISWTGNFGPNGSAARQFITSQSGTVTVTLISLTPSLDAIGVGIGVPDATASGGCAVTQEVTGVPGTDPLISAPVNTGTYCVKIFDTGLTTLNEVFSITLVYP